jgi:hypothetical protein
MARKQIDPKLAMRLKAAADSVDAVFTLRPPEAAVVADPEETRQLSAQAIERVRKTLGHGPEQVNVFSNLGSFAIRAGSEFLSELAKQPEIAAAMANEQDESMAIAPPPKAVKKAKKK